MRGFILVAMALAWLALPAVVTAEEPTPETAQAIWVCEPEQELPAHRRADWSRNPTPQTMPRECWYQHPDQLAPGAPASVAIGPAMEVAPYWAFRAHRPGLHRGRAGRPVYHGGTFPRGFRPLYQIHTVRRGWRGHRGHGRRW